MKRRVISIKKNIMGTYVQFQLVKEINGSKSFNHVHWYDLLITKKVCLETSLKTLVREQVTSWNDAYNVEDYTISYSFIVIAFRIPTEN